jgi:hypothetical protein
LHNTQDPLSAAGSELAHASHSAKAELTRFYRRITRFTPEEVAESAALLPPGHIATLRALLPDPGDQAES